MTSNEIVTIHEYITEHSLLSQVEFVTKRNWRGSGSRATYYNAVKKGADGEAESLTLVEALMMLEAQKLMVEHNAQRLAATAQMEKQVA